MTQATSDRLKKSAFELGSQLGFSDLLVVSCLYNKPTIMFSMFQKRLKASFPLSSQKALEVCSKQSAKRPGSVWFTDYFRDESWSERPVAFLGAPIFEEETPIGQLVFEIPIQEINRILTLDRKWKESGHGKSGETYLVGSDLIMRSDSRFVSEGREELFNSVRKLYGRSFGDELADKINRSGSTALILPVKTESAKLALQGKEGVITTADYRGIPVISAYAPITISGQRWAILSEIDSAEAFESITRLRYAFGGAALVILLSIVIIAHVGAQKVSYPVSKLTETVRRVQAGDYSVRLKPG